MNGKMKANAEAGGAIVVYFRFYPSICLEGLTKARTVRLYVKNRSRDLPEKNHDINH